ncbi:MAG: hypothetical protein JO336_23735, partial [Acidobacteriia bacterium]|nr:hypothetical protein [Terriglobia bacterium]
MRTKSRLLMAVMLPLALGASSPDTISTYAGGGPNNVPALQANIPFPVNTALDSAGNLYIVIADASVAGAQRVFKVNTSGTLTVFAGNGFTGYAGDGGPATQAELYDPEAVAVDSSGNAYIADTNNCIIRKVTASTGVISTFAGIPNGCGYSGDGGPATSAELNVPAGVALDSSGNLYIADLANNRIRKVTASSGIISTIAGNGTAGYAGDGGPAISAQLNGPSSVALDSSGNVYIADTGNYRIRKVTAGTGEISTIAGNGTAGYSGGTFGLAIYAEISNITGIAVDSAGNVFIADQKNAIVREVTTSGFIQNVAGVPLSAGFSGDGGPSTSAELDEPAGVAVSTVSGVDQVYIADYANYRIRKAAVGGNIDTVAGNGSVYYAAGVTATGASLSNPTGLTADGSGNTYIADNGNCVIRKVTASTGDISIIA